MKKFIYILSPILAFFLGSFWVLHIKAAAPAPVPDSSTIQLVEVVSSVLNDMMFTSHYINHVSGDLTSFNANMNFGALPYTDIWNWDSSDFTTTPLTQEEINQILLENDIYNTSGTSISTSDEIYRIDYDNGAFHGHGYIDSTGKILYTSPNLGGQLLYIGIGGNQVSVSEFIKGVSDISDMAIQNNLQLSSNFPITNTSFYWYQGYSHPDFGSCLSELYIPNIYLKGTCVTEWNSSYMVPNSFYFNSLDDIYFTQTNNEPIIAIFILQDAGEGHYYTYDGYNYRYRLRFNNSLINNAPSSDWSLNSYDDFANGSATFFCIGKNVKRLGTAQSPQNVIEFVPLNNTKSIIDPNGLYSYESLVNAKSQIESLPLTKNQTFDTSLAISPENFPYYVAIPQDMTIPSYNPSPDPGPVPDPSAEPSLGPDIGNVDPSDLRSSIPVINNLLNRFPFSIPWDIYSLISGLSAQRETPYIDTTLTIPVINYVWHIQYDLSAFDGVASLFRTLFLISFVIGLAYFSYDHFFGS